MGKIRKKCIVVLLTSALLLSGKVSVMAEDAMAKQAGQETVTLHNPIYDSGVREVAPGTQTAVGKLHNPTYDAATDTAEWDCVWFGNYWQSDTNGDGVADQKDEKEPIKWRVLSVDGDDIFLLADETLDAKPYNETNTAVTWETCTLRSWLNGYGSSANVCGTDYTSDNFIMNAFSATEQAAIKRTDVVNADNPGYGTEGGNDTTDKVYLLSIAETSNPAYGFNSEYKEGSDTRVALNTAHRRIDIASDCWWLRSPGRFSDYVAYVGSNGYGLDNGLYVSCGLNAVRPALHLTLSSSAPLTYAGTVQSNVRGNATWDCVYFGNYWQSDTNGDGVADKKDDKEPIKWRVLSVGEDDIFLLADETLDAKLYNETNTAVSWETCTLRSWLNGYGSSANVCGTGYTSDNFITNAFSAIEQTVIKTTDVVNADNPEYGTEGGSDTRDKVFLLSMAEACDEAYGFFTRVECDSDTRVALNTAYTKEQGTYTSISRGSGEWWLRSPGRFSNYAAYVCFDGSGLGDGLGVTSTYAVRPALHLTLSSSTPLTYAGTVCSDGTVTAGSGTVAVATPTASLKPTAMPTNTAKPTSKPTAVPTSTPTIQPTPKDFIWGEGNWNFDNTSRYFANYDVNSEVMAKMKQDFHLSNADIVELKWNIAEDNKYGFGGSCFGMTISEIMAHQGDLKLSRYGGNDIVNKNTNTSNMTSVINFIQELQSNSEMCQSIRQTPFLRGSYSQTEFISKLREVAADATYLVKLSYKIVTKNANSGSAGDGYHAVLVYGMENCNYYSSVTGKTYDKKILIADPNYLSGNAVNDDACLYVKSSDSSWIVPYWNKTYSNGSVQSCYWNAEEGTSTGNGGIRNIMRYESLKEEVDLMSEFNAGHYIAGLEIDNKSQNVSAVEKVKNSGNPNADYAGDFSEEIVRYDTDMDDNIYMKENGELYAMWNPTASYILSYTKPSDYNLKMDYESVDYYADVTNSVYTMFKPSGSITLKGSDVSYDITMVMDDDECVTDWYAVTVSGADVDEITYTKVKDGYTLSADDMQNIKISAEGEDFNVDTTFSTEYDKVFIHEVDEKTIGVAVDTDKNGTYETLLDTVSRVDEKPLAPKPTQSPPVKKDPSDSQTTAVPRIGQMLRDTSSGAFYQVVSAGASEGTVSFVRPIKKTKKVNIPAMISYGGKKYKVTSIAKKAFAGNKKLKTVIIGKNVKTIEKNAFKNCRALQKITVKSNVLTKVGKNAFKGTNKRLTIKVPKKKKAKYKKLFKGKGNKKLQVK